MEMNVQSRYDEIVALSGQSEEVVRRVLRAAKESLAASLRKGERATLPGICTLSSEIREKLDTNSLKSVSYIKIKAKASNAMETEVNKGTESTETETDNKEIKLNVINNKPSGIRLKQINALL